MILDLNDRAMSNQTCCRACWKITRGAVATCPRCGSDRVQPYPYRPTDTEPQRGAVVLPLKRA